MSPFTIEMATKSTALLVGVVALSLVFRRRSAETRHLVWALGLLSLLFLPIFAAQVPAVEIARPVEIVPSAKPPVNRLEPFRVPSTPTIEATPAPAPPFPKSTNPFPWAAVLTAIWGTGVVAILLQSSVSILRARGIAARGERLDAPAPLRIVRSSEVEVPMMFGIVRPVILLPQASLEWSPERMKTVLLHESAHVGRMDWGWIAVGRVACALYWPNPLVWWAESRLRAESELAADDAVLNAGVPASRYAEDLVEIAAGLHSHSRPAHALSMVESANLKSRVRLILDSVPNRHPLSSRAMFTAMAIWGLTVIAFAATRVVRGADTVRLGVVDLSEDRRLSIVGITEMVEGKARSWNMKGELLRQPLPVENATSPPPGTVRRHVVFLAEPQGDPSIQVLLPGTSEPAPIDFYNGSTAYSIRPLRSNLLVATLDFPKGASGRFTVRAPREGWRMFGRASFRKGVRMSTSNVQFEPTVSGDGSTVRFDVPPATLREQLRIRLNTDMNALRDSILPPFSTGRQSVSVPNEKGEALTSAELYVRAFRDVVFEDVPLVPGKGLASATPAFRLPGLIRANGDSVDLPDGSRMVLQGVEEGTPKRSWAADGGPAKLSPERLFRLGDFIWDSREFGRLLSVWTARRPASEREVTTLGVIYDESGRALSAGASSTFESKGARIDGTAIQVQPGQRSTSLIFQVPVGATEVIQRLKPTLEAGDSPEMKKLRVAYPPSVTLDNLHEYRIVPLDARGDEVGLRYGSWRNTVDNVVYLFAPRAEAARIKSVEIRHRPSRWVEFPDVRLVPKEGFGMGTPRG